MPTIGATDEAFRAFAKNVLRWLLLDLSAIPMLFFPDGFLPPILSTLFTVFAILFPSYSLEYIRVRLTIFQSSMYSSISQKSRQVTHFSVIFSNKCNFNRIKPAREQMPRLTNYKYNHVWAVTEHAM